MLGEINLAQWKCLAELIDNSVDGFLSVLRAGGQLAAPEIHIQVPMSGNPNAMVSVIDNGPGMSAEVLERAVSAGWSGNDPISALGLFGMGFNIATARLGTVTTVWTTRAGDKEWIGLKIDFDALRAQRQFKTPRLTDVKHDEGQHGTKVIIEKLKPEQRDWFARAANRTKTQDQLGRVYAAMLRPGGVPLSFKLTFCGKSVEGRRHCVWSGPGGATRTVTTARHGVVDAFQSVDRQLPPRPFCMSCWQWIGTGEDACPSCGKSDDVIQRQRSIRGWLGIQRYLSETDYGIDFLRHGRKIETANKELFMWGDGEAPEPEYPIDDPRNRGRIVGEIHLDHCRVSYTKDRFERTDPAWEDMVRLVRGEGPLRPDKASDLGYLPNETPLFKLFQVFRRSTPKPKNAGAWARLLVVPNNELAEEMAKKFHAGTAEYQTDDKWFQLVEEEDRKLLLGGSSGSPPGTPPPTPGADDVLPGFGGDGNSGPANAVPAPPAPPSPPAQATPIPSLSRQYVSHLTELKWTLKAFQVAEEHPLVEGSLPWRLRATPHSAHEFYVNVGHPIFASATMTPLDGLLAELAWTAMDFMRSRQEILTFGAILADLRARYASGYALDPATLSNEARQSLADIASAVGRNIEPSDAPTLFKSLPLDDQKQIFQKMAARGAANPQSIVSTGRFLEYAPPTVVAGFYRDHPELFLDGRCWEEPYSELNYEVPEATETARARVFRHFEALLSDAVWLADQDPADLGGVSRAKLLRALYALELLSPVDGTEAS
ncbi:hypothetical protein A176_005271 [Myxococcus hansupus]|uniref:ATP-binding protein n=2 Tax=Pseudomyxococcus hansupus TaxID=1297742 RepID=A0A0H4WZV5_9BACT|nr:hypothetical protein A176_005271 [Myxococcus hansupus]